MTPKQIRYSKSGPAVVEALKKRHFEAWYVDTAAEAVKKALELIPAEDVVSWGGSTTIDEIGLKDKLRERGNPLIDRDSVDTPAEKAELMRRGLTCDPFIMSSNAVTEDGQLFNIDGNGNRVAAMIVGPKSVVGVAGMNKVVKTIQDAYTRVRTIVAPTNAQRFQGSKTPCAQCGQCGDCLSPDSICAYMVATRICRPAGKIKVILVGEDLGM